MAQALHSKIAGQKENTQPRSKLTHSVQHTREMEESISAQGGEASFHLSDIDLNNFFSDENEPSSSGAQPLFQNCKLQIQNLTINIVKK